MSIATLFDSHKCHVYVGGMAPARHFTDEEQEFARNLSRIWDAKREERKFTQQDAADELGWTQGTIHQYVRGKIPLNNVAILKFAQFLEVYPTEIDPGFLQKILRPELADIIDTYLRMHEKNRSLWKQTGHALAEPKTPLDNLGD